MSIYPKIRLIPYTRASAGREDSPGVEFRRSVFSERDFSTATAAAASSSCFFFLNRVSAMGRKNVQSNPYCLQCWHRGGSESDRMSHLFHGGESANGWKPNSEEGSAKRPWTAATICQRTREHGPDFTTAATVTRPLCLGALLVIWRQRVLRISPWT